MTKFQTKLKKAFQMCEKVKEKEKKKKKHCGKWRRYWLPSFFPFPQCFQKIFSLGSLKFVIVYKVSQLIIPTARSYKA